MSQGLKALALVEDPDLVCQVYGSLYPSVTPDLSDMMFLLASRGTRHAHVTYNIHVS